MFISNNAFQAIPNRAEFKKNRKERDKTADLVFAKENNG